MIDHHTATVGTPGLGRLIGHLLQEASAAPRGPLGQAGSSDDPALTVYEEGDQLVIEAQLPGMKPQDIDASIEQGVLTIRGGMKPEDMQQHRQYLIREQRAGRFSRSLRLPDTVDPDAVQATYEDGVLRLTLAKDERARAHRIQIETSDREPLRAAEHAV